MATLRLFFSGLCGFVPSTITATTTPPDVAVSAVRVLLAEGRGLHSGHGGGGTAAAHEYHEPVLRVVQDHVVTGSGLRSPDMEVPSSGLRIFFLADQDLRIDLAGGKVDLPSP